MNVGIVEASRSQLHPFTLIDLHRQIDSVMHGQFRNDSTFDCNRNRNQTFGELLESESESEILGLESESE